MAGDDERPLETGWLDDTPVDDNLLRRFVHNQGEMTEATVTALGGRIERVAGAFLADARSPIPYFNQATLTRPLDGPTDPRLGEIEAWYEPSPHAVTLLSMWPTGDLSARGWTLVGHPALTVRAPTPIEHTPPPGVEVVRAANRTELDEAARIVVDGYPMEEARGLPPAAVFPDALLGSNLTLRLGLLEGTPVAVGMGFVAHGVVNLCLGATLPAARRRGVWEALVWARASDGPDLPTVAYTSDHSRPGFVRMGFMVVTRFTLWMR